MGVFINSICDSRLPYASQHWSHIFTAIISVLEIFAVFIFLYIHRKSKYFRQTLPRRKSFSISHQNNDDYHQITNDEFSINQMLPYMMINTNAYQSPSLESLKNPIIQKKIHILNRNKSPLQKSLTSSSNRNKIQAYSLPLTINKNDSLLLYSTVNSGTKVFLYIVHVHTSVYVLNNRWANSSSPAIISIFNSKQ